MGRDRYPATRHSRPLKTTDAVGQGHRPAQSGVNDRNDPGVIPGARPRRYGCGRCTLSGLEAAGVVTYRNFADEYRIWQGTDVDIRRLLDAARQRTGRQSLVETLSHVDQPLPVGRGATQRQIRRTPSVHQTLYRRQRARRAP